MKLLNISLILLLIQIFNQLYISSSFAAEIKTKKHEISENSVSSLGDAEQINVDSIKEKYWSRGDEAELGVVQNRTYSKKGKFEGSLLSGVLFSDPFLDVKLLGFELGYHISEYVSAHLLGFKHFVDPSSALLTFQDTLGGTVNTNLPRYYVGAEGMGSLFYGKLSVLGKAIIYYDFYFLAGSGITNTESGTFFTPSLGIGQRFYINKFISIRLDYRLMAYRETILEKVVPTMIGQVRGERNNWNNTITLGFSLSNFGN